MVRCNSDLSSSNMSAMRTVLVLTVCLLAVTATWSDAIMQTRAMSASTIVEYFIDDDGVRVEMEIGLEDLQAFGNLMPDEIWERLGNAPRPLGERLGLFFSQDFIVVPDDGDPIFGRIVAMEPRERIKRDEISGEQVEWGEEEPETIIFVELLFPFKSRPARLTIGGPGSARMAEIGFVVYHEELPVNDFRYLSDAYRVELDWNDPWYSRFESRQLRRTYYAAMSGFLYVEPYEVRKEIIVRPIDLQRWVDLGLDGRETIPPEMQAELTRRAAEFLRAHHTVLIDGQAVAPDLARINFLRRTLRNSTVIDPPEELSTNSATLGAIFVYPTEGLPENVTMEWDLFDDRIDVVPAASVDQAGPLPSVLTPDYPVLEWQNFLQNPILPTLVVTEAPPSMAARSSVWLRWVLLLGVVWSVIWIVRALGRTPRKLAVPVVAAWVCLGLAVGAFWLARGAVLNDQRANDLVAGLLHNVYRAFDFRQEEQIYDVLDKSVEGDLLTQIYLETRRGLELRNQGGARAKVKEIELIDLETSAGRNGGFVARVIWNVGGSVGHWGHVHTRKNQYQADLDIQPVNGVWKLTSLTVIEEKRL